MAKMKGRGHINGERNRLGASKRNFHLVCIFNRDLFRKYPFRVDEAVV